MGGTKTPNFISRVRLLIYQRQKYRGVQNFVSHFTKK